MATTESELLPVPEGMTLTENKSQLTLQWRWFSVMHIALMGFSVIWLGFLFVWYRIALSGDFDGEIAWLILLFPIGHLAVGVGMFYSALAGLLNRTTLTVSRQSLQVKHSPLWMPGQCEIPAKELTQLFCKEKRYENKGSVTYRYLLYALLKSGSEKKLLTLDTQEYAQWLEHKIESYLHIENQAVAGELSSKTF
jgi:hypothetical protein